MDANDLVARLTRRALETPGIHVAPAGPSDAFDFAAYRLSAQPETAARVVRGGHARSTAAMFDEFAAAWQFPPYFGRNWPAFDECLGDLDWLPARAYVLVVLDAQKLLDHEPPEAFQALVDRLVELTHEGPGPVLPRTPRGRGRRGDGRRGGVRRRLATGRAGRG
jgi:hypothetical protein